MQTYPAAERLAWDLSIETDDIDELVALWTDAYATRYRSTPGSSETAAARQALEQRIAGAVPPLPSSASTSGVWQVPCVELGVPDR